MEKAPTQIAPPRNKHLHEQLPVYGVANRRPHSGVDGEDAASNSSGETDPTPSSPLPPLDPTAFNFNHIVTSLTIKMQVSPGDDYGSRIVASFNKIPAEFDSQDTQTNKTLTLANMVQTILDDCLGNKLGKENALAHLNRLKEDHASTDSCADLINSAWRLLTEADPHPQEAYVFAITHHALSTKPTDPPLYRILPEAERSSLRVYDLTSKEPPELEAACKGVEKLDQLHLRRLVKGALTSEEPKALPEMTEEELTAIKIATEILALKTKLEAFLGAPPKDHFSVVVMAPPSHPRAVQSAQSKPSPASFSKSVPRPQSAPPMLTQPSAVTPKLMPDPPTKFEDDATTPEYISRARLALCKTGDYTSLTGIKFKVVDVGELPEVSFPTGVLDTLKASVPTQTLFTLIECPLFKIKMIIPYLPPHSPEEILEEGISAPAQVAQEILSGVLEQYPADFKDLVLKTSGASRVQLLGLLPTLSFAEPLPVTTDHIGTLMALLMELLFNLDDSIDRRAPKEFEEEKKRLCSLLPESVSSLMTDSSLENPFDKEDKLQVSFHFIYELARTFARMLNTTLLVMYDTTEKQQVVSGIIREMTSYLKACVTPKADAHLNPINYRDQRKEDGAVKLVECIVRTLHKQPSATTHVPSDHFAFLLGMVNDLVGVRKDIKKTDEEGSVLCCFPELWAKPNEIMKIINQLMLETFLSCCREDNLEMLRWHFYHLLWCLSFQKRYGGLSQDVASGEAELLAKFLGNPAPSPKMTRAATGAL